MVFLLREYFCCAILHIALPYVKSTLPTNQPVLASVVVLREETIPPYAVAFKGTNITKCKYCMYCYCINILQEGSTAGVRSALATYPPEKKTFMLPVCRIVI
jgi:hypothetical protein